MPLFHLSLQQIDLDSRTTCPRRRRRSFPKKRTRKYRAKLWCFEKHFSQPENKARKTPRKLYGPEKFSGLLRNARLNTKSIDFQELLVA